jgi:hypothetical protein
MDRKVRSPAWLNVLLGAWLFISPWVLDYTAADDATANAWVIGGAIAVLAAIVAVTGVRSLAWSNIALGVWLFVSPWALGFAGLQDASWNAWIVGVLAVIVAAGSASTGGAVRQPPSRLGAR